MKLEIKKFNELKVEELYEILKIRSDVFIIEQNCNYSDIDGKDLNAIHIILRENSKIVAYLRILKPNVSYTNASIGRVLVAKEARGKNYAKRIVSEAIKYITEIWKEKKITIGAQNYLLNFYKNFGFKAISEVYLDAGIPHIDMTYIKSL